jgi:putative transposase
MVEAVRGGRSMRSVARQFHVSLSTVEWWVERARGQQLEEVNWSDRSSAPHRTRRTDPLREDLVLSLRQRLQTQSDLGEFGAAAIRREWLAQGLPEPLSVRTVGRILKRRGALDGKRRVRRPPPPVGWYLPEVASARCELDSFDVIEGLVIEGGTEVRVLNGISLHGGLVVSWPTGGLTTTFVMEALTEHWRGFGLPGFVQFDNDTLFQGAHQFADSIGRVSRFCLSLGVTPVFAPPRESGFQAAIESFNARWQAKVWQRFHHDSLSDLQTRSARYIQAHRQRCAQRIEAAPRRRGFPQSWRWIEKAPLAAGKLIYLRRSNDRGVVELLGHRFEVHPSWTHRLVRCEVDCTQNKISFFALRRRDPMEQPLLSQVDYELQQKWLHR